MVSGWGMAEVHIFYLFCVCMCVCVCLFHYSDLRSQSLVLPLIQKSSYLPSQRMWSDYLTSLKYLWDGKTLMLNLVRYVFQLLSWQVEVI